MKIRKIAAIACIFAVLAVACIGCTEKEQDTGFLDGSWAYNHEPEETAFKVNGDSAVLDGVKYSCSYDDSYVTLTDKKGNTEKHRYIVDGEEILLYKTAVYVYSGDSVPDGFYGYWKNDANWSWEFTAAGEFCEDGYFYGYYSVDEATNAIKLMYTDHYYDTYIYYTVDGNVLTIEYPWRMVRK